MERPEEKKNDQLVEKIPDKLLNPINDAQKTKATLSQKFFQISLQRANLENKYQETFSKLANTGKSIGNKIQRAFAKMKLGKKKNYRWQYDGKGAFIGIPRPTPKPKDDTKK